MTGISYENKGTLMLVGIISSLAISLLTVEYGILATVAVIALSAVILGFIIILKSPMIALMTTIIYCFIVGFFARELPAGIPFGYLVEVLYAVVLVAIIFKPDKDWGRIKNDLCLLFSLWFIISVVQVVNPGSSVRGWVSEIRSSGLDSFLLVPLGFMVFKTNKHLNAFIIVILVCSLLGALNGIKQLHFGFFPGERAFLDANPTHMIWGQLRVFSFYRDAGQFGASQAHMALVAGILALGPFKIWKRVLLGLLALLFFYGMLISGTRGSFFVLVPGALLAIFLLKNVRVLLLGILFLTLFVAVLKYTYIGSSFSYVHRLRTALNPEDASLNVRYESQAILKDYLQDLPFGGGLGVLGYAGEKYNSDKFLSTIAPDSYWVKVWAMYGITGFVFWFCMMMYILGKCSGIIWKVKNNTLRIKLVALASGFCGIFVASYGNEVINTMPSSIVVYLSIVFVFIGPELDRESFTRKLS